MGSLLTAGSRGPLPAQAPEELSHLKEEEEEEASEESADQED
jgi:hypothetical protein